MMTDGTGHKDFADEARGARLVRRWAVEEDTMSWRHELHPEIMDAFAEKDPVKLLTNLREVRETLNGWITDLQERIAAGQMRGEIGPINENPELYQAMLSEFRAKEATKCE